MATLTDDPQLEEVIEELASAMGQPKAASVRIAVEEKLERLRKSEPRKIDWTAIRAIQDRVAKMPILDDRSEDELLGYNEFGTFD
ncbi:MAG: type II toxin-antitoxin system VapB family antitoxin [Acidobacteriota bacterium]